MITRAVSSSNDLNEREAAAIVDALNGPLSNLDTGLVALALGYATKSSNANVPSTNGMPSDGYIAIDAIANNGDGESLLVQLKNLGLKSGASYSSVAGGLFPIANLQALAALPDLASAHRSLMESHAGSVTTQADSTQHDDIARANYGVDGTGITVGILSDSFNTSGNGSMETDIASGDLPSTIKILQDYTDTINGTEDEGRGMAQLVHDIAPGAAIDFATAFISEAGFASNILALAQAGAKIIVDDVSYGNEPYYQDGIVAQAIDQVAAMGVTYFSSAGNENAGYNAAFKNSGATTNFQGRSEQFDQLTPGSIGIKVNKTGWYTLDWDQPAASAGGSGSSSDLDFFVTNQAGTPYQTSSSDYSIDNNINGDPVEYVYAYNGDYLRVGLHSGQAPDHIHIDPPNSATWNLSQAGITDYSSLTPHAGAAGAIGVAAASFSKTPQYGVSPPQVEGFSSAGPVQILFDEEGNPLSTPDVRRAPQITAVDGGNTTFFGTDSSQDSDTLPNFFGTSAAAPDAAATAALMLQADKTLTRQDILNLLEDSSIDMDDPNTSVPDTGFDPRTGAGLIQADAAVGYAKTHVFTADVDHLVMAGSHAADRFVVTGSGAHTIDGAGGSDTVDYTGTTSTIVVTLGDVGTPVTVSVDGTLRDTISSIENVTGGSANDQITGDADKNVIIGGGGNDVLDGGDGLDTLTGGAGTDTYQGTVGELSGDTVVDIAQGERVLVLGATSDMTAALSGTKLTVDPDGKGALTAFTMTLSNDTGAKIASVQDGAINFTVPNRAPTASAGTAAGSEDAKITGQITAFDPDGDDLTYAVVKPVVGLTLNPSGSFSFDPQVSGFDSLAAGQKATVTFQATVSDGLLTSKPVTETITITGVNDVPTASADTVALYSSGAAVAVTAKSLLANDTDPDKGDVLTLSAADATSAKGSTIARNSKTGDLTYTPSQAVLDAAESGPVTDTFSYTVSDKLGATSQAQVAVTFRLPNAAPTAQNGNASVTEGGAPLAGQVTATDPNPGDTLTYKLVKPVAGVVLNADGTFTFTPDGMLLDGQTKQVAFQFTATDQGNLASKAGTETITVTGANDAPVAKADALTYALKSGPLSTPAATLLKNDTDPDKGDVLTLTGVSGSSQLGGSVSLSKGSVLYDPGSAFVALAAGQTATDTFTYTVADKAGAQATGTVSVALKGVNDAPSGTDGTATYTSAGHTFAAADFGFSDPDQGDALSGVKIATLPGAGTLQLAGKALAKGATVTAADVAAGKLVFVPAAGQTASTS